LAGTEPALHEDQVEPAGEFASALGYSRYLFETETRGRPPSELARRAALSRSMISKAERGDASPTARPLKAVGRRLRNYDVESAQLRFTMQSSRREYSTPSMR